MKITLLSYTQDAENLLIFTKGARLGLNPCRMESIKNMSMLAKQQELEYMANTLPSSWEFVNYVFLVEGVSRAFTHQAVRTRTGSYAQQAMRIVDMSDYYYIHTPNNLKDLCTMNVINKVNDLIKIAYKKLIKEGQAIEDARGILPTNISTNIVCMYNLRAFSDLAKSRGGGRTQSEYRSVVNAMVDEVLKVHPWADKFLFQHGRDYFQDIEDFANKHFGDNPANKMDLMKIVDKMRKAL